MAIFLPFFFNDVMGFGRPRSAHDSVYHDSKEDVLGFINDTIIRQVYADVEKKYNKGFPQTELEDALKHFQYYFPNNRIHKVVTFISGFQYSAFTSETKDTTLAIGLDMYLGANYPAYQNLGFPNFIIEKMDKKFIVPNSMEVLYKLYFDHSQYNDELPLIEAMVEAGKKYYFIECMIPDTPDSLLIGYTNKQLLFCKNEEKQIWKFFNERDLLYKTSFTEKKHYLEDAPTSAGMPNDAPGKVGAWVGWQIVRKYMKESKGQVSLPELLEKNTAKEIITKAHYKP